MRYVDVPNIGRRFFSECWPAKNRSFFPDGERCFRANADHCLGLFSEPCNNASGRPINTSSKNLSEDLSEYAYCHDQKEWCPQSQGGCLNFSALWDISVVTAIHAYLLWNGRLSPHARPILLLLLLLLLLKQFPLLPPLPHLFPSHFTFNILVWSSDRWWRRSMELRWILARAILRAPSPP